MRRYRIFHRRWFQFSLRTFIVLTMLVGMGVSVLYRQLTDLPGNCVPVSGDTVDVVWIGVPSDQEVLVKFLSSNWKYASHPQDLAIVKKKVADHLEPPRFVPLVGQTQLHKVQIKCSVYYRAQGSAIGVVYFNYDHYHTTRSLDGITNRTDE